MGLLKSIFSKLLPDDNKGDKGNGSVGGQMTNKVLLRELVEHFRAKLEMESVGRRMLYPMSFNILMDVEDYNDRKQAFPFVLPEVVAAFYGVIDEMRSQYPVYTPPAKQWFFQFAPCHSGSVAIGPDSEEATIVRRGHITTVANLVPFDIMGAGNIAVDSDVRVSIKLDDSNVMNNNANVNFNAIKGLDIIGEDTFRIKFDESLTRDTEKILITNNAVEAEALATLSYTAGGKNYHYSMVDNLVHISGQSELRKGRAFFIIENSNIKESHVQIRHDKGKFQIAAFGPTKLNGRKLVESSGAPQWYELANNSSIFINEELRVKFEIKQ